jgi:hypothetical protein
MDSWIDGLMVEDAHDPGFELVRVAKGIKVRRMSGRRRDWTADEEALLGRPPFNPKRVPWTKDHLALLGKLPDAEVAVRTGHSNIAVRQKRLFLRIP